MIIHIAITDPHSKSFTSYITHITNSALPEFNAFHNKLAANFSNTTLSEFIKEERLHDDFTLTQKTKRPLLSLSSGERKKALLNHLLNQNPEFLILENPFDALDGHSVSELKLRLNALSKQLPLIQIFSRKEDLLPCITHVLSKTNHTFKLLPISEYLTKQTIKFSISELESIPPPLHPPVSCSTPLVSFKKVNVSYQGYPILHDISWTIGKGEFWELKGANGSGKSTLLTMIIGDNPKGYGQDLYIFGNRRGSGETIWDIKRKIGYFTPAMMDVFNGQHTAQHMIVSGIKDSIGLYTYPSDLEIELANAWLKLVGLLNLKDTLYYNLSESEKRLILICRAMIKHPPLLILDEPTAGLDDHGAFLFVNLANKIARESNTTVLYVSHRSETELKPTHIYQLEKTEKGSIGHLFSSI